MPLRPDMDLRDYLRIVSVRKWLIVLTYLCVFCAVGVYLLVAPKQYQSSTTILIVPQSTPENYVRSTVTVGSENLSATLQQEITSRTRLMKVVDELGLFPKLRKEAPQGEVVKAMIKRIDIAVDQTPQQYRGKNPDAETFSLSFYYGDPELAMRTTSRLASLFIEENWKLREKQAVATSSLIDTQLQDTKKRLETQEEKVKEYKLRHAGELPEELQANLGSLQRLQEQYRVTLEGIRAAEQRKVTLQGQLSVIEKGSQAVVHKDGKVEVDISDQATQALVQEINLRRSQLAALSAKYTNEYPDVVRVRGELEELEKRLAALPEASHSAHRGGQSAGTFVPLAGRDLAEFRQVKAQIAATDSEIAGLKREGEAIRRRVADLEGKVDQAPRREQDLVALSRDYDNLKKMYDDLLTKKANAKISEEAEMRQRGDRFQILDPAYLPQEPFKPKKLKLFLLGLLFASGLGFGGAIGLEWMDPTLRGTSDFRHFFNLKVLASIPDLGDGARANQGVRWGTVLGWFLLLLAGVAGVVWLYGEQIRTMLNM